MIKWMKTQLNLNQIISSNLYCTCHKSNQCIHVKKNAVKVLPSLNPTAAAFTYMCVFIRKFMEKKTSGEEKFHHTIK